MTLTWWDPGLNKIKKKQAEGSLDFCPNVINFFGDNRIIHAVLMGVFE